MAQRRSWLSWLVGVALVLVLLDGFLAVVRLRSGASRLPERGEAEELLPGLEGRAEVLLDGFGVPHVRAGSEADLWLVLGYLHARERFLQMEVARRTASGRLAEVLGRQALDSDIRLRTLRLASSARRQVGLLPADARRAVEAYSAGVNAALERYGSDIASEVWLAGVEPERWRPEDSLAVLGLFHLRLSGAAAAELGRAAQLTKLGRRRAVDLWGWGPGEAREWVPALRYNQVPAFRDGTLAGGVVPVGASSWAVAPERSATGRPLLAASLSWAPENPPPWYLVDLKAPTVRCAGATLVGVPGVLVGHTGEVAWALTPALVDDQDLYVLTVDDGLSRELVDRSWQPLRTVTERISVRGEEGQELLKVRLSERGPVVQESARELVALSWTGSSGPSSLPALLAMAHARSVSATVLAWEEPAGPPMHLVAADISGRILHQLVGLVPDRGRGGGRLPSPGEDSAWAWRGVLPLASLPRRVDPEGGVLAVAGHDVFAEGDAPLAQRLPGDYEPPWRVRRVRERVEARADWDVDRTLALLDDQESGLARALVAALRPELERHGGRTAAGLLAWDGRMAAGDTAPVLYARVVAALAADIGSDDAARAGMRRSPFGSEEVLRLLAGGMDESWWDDLRTAAVEDRPAVVGRVLDRVDGAGLPAPWGTTHQVVLSHPLAGMPVLGPVLDHIGSRGPYAVGGDGTTLGCYPHRPDPPFRATLVPSLRLVCEVGRWDRTRAVVAPGQSGRLWSPRSRDQLATWLRGGAVPLVSSVEAVERDARARLRLRPEGR